jgi:WXXGXW repeat (2 copies)
MRIVAACTTAIILAGALGCVHHSARVQPTAPPVGAPDARWVTKTPPPEADTETQPPKPHDADVWLPGYFKWNGREPEWSPGHWAKPPAGTHEWAPGVWSERSDGKWQFVDGHWQ